MALEAPQPIHPFLGVELTAIDDPHSFAVEAQAMLVCAVCHTARPWQAHHVVQKQRLRRERAPLYSPDIALRVCAGRADCCHERHTTHQAVIPLGALRDQNIAFAARWLGPGPAYEYLTRYYSGTDPRVDALLEIS